MAKQSPEYELILMLDPEVPDERREEIVVGARRRIESSGTLKQERSWGLRKMAYEIAQRNEADYRFFRFEKDGEVLDDLNHNLRITDGILRFRIFKVDPGAPVIDPPPPFSLAREGDDRPSRGRRDDRPPRGPDPDEEPSYDNYTPPAAEAPSAEPEPAVVTPAADAPVAENPAEADVEPAEPAPAADDSES